MSNFYVLEGHTPKRMRNITTWARWYETATDKRRVALTMVNGARISTVFLGLDHAMPGDNRPMLFETMVFSGPLDEGCERYSTWEEAEAGHAATVERVRQLDSQPAGTDTIAPATGAVGGGNGDDTSAHPTERLGSRDDL